LPRASKVDLVDSFHKETLHHDLVTNVLLKQCPVSVCDTSEEFLQDKTLSKENTRSLLVSVTKQESCLDNSLPSIEQANSVSQQEFLSVASQASSQESKCLPSFSSVVVRTDIQ